MKLEPRQLELQEAIVKSAHPGLSLEEAKKKEYESMGCLVYSETFYHRNHIGIQEKHKTNEGFVFSKIHHQYIHTNNVVDDIIGLPPTLSRVLNAFGDSYYFVTNSGIRVHEQEQLSPIVSGPLRDTMRVRHTNKKVCDRKLLKEDGSDATLFDQSIDTQKAIYNIICKR